MAEYRKKLIEVALPLDAINKESAREKSICQRRSKKGPWGGAKVGHFGLGEELVPVVHGRAPRAARRAFPMGRRGGARGRGLWAHGGKRMVLRRPGFSFWFCSA